MTSSNHPKPTHRTQRERTTVRPMRQLNLLKKEKSAYGGELLKTRKGRSRPRPLDTRGTMHLILKSSKARGEWSFRRPKNDAKIRELTERFAAKHGIKVLSLANVGNHLHFHIKLTNRFTYRSFIRAITAAIAMAITGASRWKPLKREAKDRFWDYRPFTRVVAAGLKSFLTLRDYLRINELEGAGYQRADARWMIERARFQAHSSRSGSGSGFS